MNKNIITLGDKCVQLYPKKVPVIINYFHIPNKINRFLVDDIITINNILIQIRRKNKMAHTDSIYALINQTIVNNSEIISDLYQKFKNFNDGCLHITIHKENIFGN
jgi:hypothetical protein